MFVLRSAFWLFVAFMLVHPALDLGKAGTEALAAGKAAATATVGSVSCQTMECTGAKMMVTAALSSPLPSGHRPPLFVSQPAPTAVEGAPYPAPRLVRKG